MTFFHNKIVSIVLDLVHAVVIQRMLSAAEQPIYKTLTSLESNDTAVDLFLL